MEDLIPQEQLLKEALGTLHLTGPAGHSRLMDDEGEYHAELQTQCAHENTDRKREDTGICSSYP